MIIILSFSGCLVKSGAKVLVDVDREDNGQYLEKAAKKV